MWVEDILMMMDNSVYFDNPDYGNQDRTDEFLRNMK